MTDSATRLADLKKLRYLLVERDGGRIQSAAWHTLEATPSAPARMLPTLYAAGTGSRG